MPAKRVDPFAATQVMEQLQGVTPGVAPVRAPARAQVADTVEAPAVRVDDGGAADGRPVPAKKRGRVLRFLRRAAEVLTIAVALGTLGMWCSIPQTARLAEENPKSTAFIDLRRAEAEHEGRPFRLQWTWRPLGRISRYLRAAIIYAEDYNFYRHDGVDWEAIEDALESDLDRGSLSIGGSTITQQLAKNLYLSPNRSMLRKGREMLIAFSLEDHLSKQRILELYLNVVEWGDGVFGAEAAANHWYHHSAQSLTPAEAARLAIALPNPRQRAPNVRDPVLTKKAVRIIRLLRMQGLLDAAQERQALDEVGAPEEKVIPDRPHPADAAGAPPPPDTGQPKPDTGQPKPDTGQPKPDTGQPKPDTGQPSPDTGQPKPDTGQPNPDTGQPKPDTGQPKPDTGQPPP